ncbi:MAG TPA: hypothetical protein VF070_43615 [Streptosporangiaceae bacterium]
MLKVQPWGPVDHLVRAVGGRDEQVLEAITEIGPQQVADVLVAEIGTRWDPPVTWQELPINLHLQFEDRLYSYVATIKDDQLLIEPGTADNAGAEIRYSLAELARLLYAPRDGYPSTREIIIRAWPKQKPQRPDPTASADPEQRAVERYSEGRALFQSVQSVTDACSARLVSMDQLSGLYGTDKWGSMPSFAPHYEAHFERFRRDPVKVLEIGIGAYQLQSLGGDSLYMWQRFFPRGLIYGMDIFDKPNVKGPRIRTIKGDQSDPEFLRRLGQEEGPFDIIIDDGSHINDHVRISFESLFPYVRAGGYYVIEDFQTSYWPEFGGELPPGSPRTTAGLIRDLIDQIHFREFAHVEDDEARKATHPSDIHIYHNLVFLGKGMNHEQGSPEWIREGAKKRFGAQR